MDIKEHGSVGATFTVTNGDCHSSRTVKSGTSKSGAGKHIRSMNEIGIIASYCGIQL